MRVPYAVRCALLAATLLACALHEVAARGRCIEHALARIQADFRRALLAVKPDAALPF